MTNKACGFHPAVFPKVLITLRLKTDEATWSSRPSPRCRAQMSTRKDSCRDGGRLAWADVT
jgi:hypothetical protein